jgi:hypothetical protein
MASSPVVKVALPDGNCNQALTVDGLVGWAERNASLTPCVRLR